MLMSGSEILLDALEKEGVEVMFGFPGGAILPVYDAIYDSKIRHILVRHEQGAAHAADGYARSTGKVGVCIATSGPGATNLVTGIATAYMDSIPMVAITGQVGTDLLGNDSFQEADIFGITIPITKYNYLVKKVEDLPGIIKEAFYIARTGRPGPVLIDIPKNVQVAKIEYDGYPKEISISSYNPTIKGNPRQIKLAAEAISKAERPVIYAGGGVIISGAADELKQFAEKIEAPVTMTLMGLGGFPGTHILSMGMLGMHGTHAANHAVTESDLLIAIGARFDDRVTGKLSAFAPNAKVIHIDIDPAEIGKRKKADIPIVGDIKQVLQSLIKEIKTKSHSDWAKRIENWKAKHPLTYKNEKGKLKPQFVIEKIYEVTKGDAIITTEVGQNQMWAAQYYKFDKPRKFLTSGGLGTMGYGFPAAIGAQAANPGKVVFDIAGDGSIQMNIQELGTAVCSKLPVKIAILNNFNLGMVRQWQELFFNKRYSNTCLSGNPDFVALAKAYGAHGILVKKQEEVIPAIKEAMKINDRPTIIDFRVEPEENVFPMVPAGAAITDMIQLA
ncbi:MAG: biosynthetic-type acetolactate synthase large subunit [bacterium]|nr:biosynthetic-type acetolactate synthase large subunit [bacterium]